VTSSDSRNSRAIDLRADIVIIGGGVGGVAAALAACDRGATVILTEETDWIGGQLTSQGVPPDEHPWIERFGSTASYRRFRSEVRRYYRDWYPLTAAARADPFLNPGEGTVSPLCFEPAVAVAVLEGMLRPHLASGRLTLLRETVAIAADAGGDHVRAVTVRDLKSGIERRLHGIHFLDATELGDVLELAGVEYVSGAESRAETGEEHAPEVADPLNMQAIAVCFAIDHVAGADLTIDKPAQYDTWSTFAPANWTGRLLALSAPDPRTLEPKPRRFEPNEAFDGDIVADQSLDGGDDDLWVFRRIASRRQFLPGAFESDITLVNWPQIDYWDGPLFGVPDPARHRENARQLSLSMLYWLQTEAPREDGGTGWPGLRLRGDVLGTADGLAKAPYVRESRRIRALTTVVEQDLSAAVRGGRPAEQYPDSIGVGSYRIDLHPSTGGDGYIDIASTPYRIPLGALIPRRVRNLLPAAKNIGTTHITNGCYRMHPTEWNIGEVAGSLAAHAIATGSEPHAVATDPRRFAEFHASLVRQGVETAWPVVEAY
jgi:hypothetical protein